MSEWRASRRARSAEVWQAMRPHRAWLIWGAIGKAITLVAPVLLILSQASTGSLFDWIAIAALLVGPVLWLGGTAVLARRARVSFGRALWAVWLVPTWTLLEVFAPV